ncbi:putative dolichyl-P-Man:GDP-ManGlcNAc2-PP-dolichyl beta-14-mannosyltransferase [Leptomonas pyrrhocoris]|uniref:Putative dolichyl-P-Man:GDP-ManGlcNAc2-PP-dolichyl beta-14-mannosyltransferase n=1 Tax=Leptomonas pyrrhocoris TaxID=157538 RepID=A0A0M9FYJ6_LEPPY|nr:putative dolichyl-P-Man:GDP-ManGlcNAc2-PP-dolichyl beta-14-mannosyltransferase [Leptomonas pyrrhocoris]XP_015657016.1 putative dolichyl-P-Man:GDP-ManGlcNAc2-PP-dolichyl beta-14-mannosyltransferase [Leptomonas pyrrhocoris]KPA78571.1 putative dolichyl-P-Man:GDP-ManGlcNAc2-PP-dolichyl beta-14-mannosyltransferase [Leptomonas pyrrhocoris]KPA78577.1 putative dolichyl-P-Man:GDP-ManGlcNAc2-PP-dolichyl beta-14-mannosyltransferase [Leptomonas pyrrhocoris]|eukprot:XP_015657010.1 putative dolichyl-P-Man:GDP-ManGlcNAc2-PP-dolichyl beta-14-mannosyltransferase [Leptomonas pyrrhocoris]
MFQYEDLMWLISFPLVCAVMLWFSLDLAVLVRVGGGRRRRSNARRAIERLIMSSPVCAPTSVESSRSSPATPTGASTEPVAQRGSAAASLPEREASNNNNSSSSAEGEYSTRQNATTLPSSSSTPYAHRQPQRYQKVRLVTVPAALRIATRAVVRRAVVMVGGDFARSPRMQYHAASLARSGLFDEVLLVGLDCGNQLSEDLLMSGEPQPERFVTREGTTKNGMEHAVYDVQARVCSPAVHAGHGCIISTRYLTRPPSPPEWFQAVFPLRSLHWAVCTLYRFVALTLLFGVQMARVTAMRISGHGQLFVTDLIMIQTPPAVPFVPLVKYVVCPFAFLYNMLLYYGVVVPAAWMHPDAMRDMRRECRLQSHRFRAQAEETHVDGADDAGRGAEPRAVVPRPSRIRPWVFYPAIVVDWHNYGYTILEQNGRPTAAVELYKLFEVHLCAGDVNVTVSRAMRHSLECFYPWLKSRAAAASPLSSLAARSYQFVRGKPHKAAVESTTTAAAAASLSSSSSLSLSTSAVTVLYDVAPSFFRPVSRRRCVRDVLDRLLRRHATSPSTPAAASSSNNGTSAVAAGSYTLVSASELENMGWGIAGPPPWVYAEAAAESPSSSHESPSSPLSPSAVFGPSTAGAAAPRKGIVMVGSTSWTEEDDYSVLIRALRRLDHRLNHAVGTYCSTNGNSTNGSSSFAQCNAAPLDLWVLITGKGPARRRFEEAVRAAKLSAHVVVSTYYAQSYKEYSVLVGAADVGFCLHLSSSGLDLPMKGVDMVGAGLPVIALQYPAIEELMGGVTRVLVQTRAAGSSSSAARHGVSVPAALVECERGWVFRGDVDLEALLSSFVGLPGGERTGSLMDGGGGRGGSDSVALTPTPLSVMKRKALEARLHAPTWADNWTRVLLPVLQQVV